MARVFIAAWASTVVTARGRMHDALALPGLVAEIDGRPAGLLTYMIEGSECEVITLNSIVERSGVGSRLLSGVVAAAREAGCSRICLTTSNDNLPALRFYQRRGFQIVAVYPNSIDKARAAKPEIPKVGLYGIPLRDEIELELRL